MANIKIPRKEFEKQIKLTKEIEEKIPLFGTPLESLNNEEIELEIFPDRPDLLSPQGWMRSFKTFLGKPVKDNYKVKKSGLKVICENSLPKEWPYAVACIVKNLKLDDQKIKDLVSIQEKLGFTVLRDRKKGGAGLYPLEGITFPVKFLGMHPDKIKFRPLEYPSEITGKQILTRHPKGKSYGHICQSWSKLPVFIDAKNNIMSMPPIINSHNLGKVSESTTDVFLEVTGKDLQTIKKVLTIFATALADMGGTIYSLECQQISKNKENLPDLKPGKMKISLENANKQLGLSLKESDLQKLLPKMGYTYKKPYAYYPAWRSDILHEVDVIEDIAIAYGYNKLVPEIPKITTIGQESQQSLFEKKLAELLAGLGLLEISSYHLIKPQEAKKIKNPGIELLDTKTEYKVLRPSLLPSALRILSENKDHAFPQNIFEIGTVFSKDSKEEAGIKESQNLLVALSPGNFTQIKQVLDALTSTLKKKYKLQETSDQLLISGRTGSILINNKPAGKIGEVHPQTLRDFNIKMPVSLLEIDLKALHG